MADADDTKWVGHRNFKRPFSRILNVADDSAAGLQLAGSNRPQRVIRCPAPIRSRAVIKMLTITIVIIYAGPALRLSK